MKRTELFVRLPEATKKKIEALAKNVGIPVNSDESNPSSEEKS